MLWIVFFIGLFIGANAGIVMAGMLFLAKQREKEAGSTTQENKLHQSPRDRSIRFTDLNNSQTLAQTQ